MITVVTFLWSDPHRQRGYTFGPRHVALVQSMVKRNLTMEHEFVCVTDWVEAPRHTENGIRWVPIDWRKHVGGTCFVKLMLHRPDIAGLLGRRILYLDLDCVVTGSLNDIVARGEDAVFWRNPNWSAGGRRAFYQGSMQLFTAGGRSELWTDFDPAETPKWVNRRYGGAEQAWISERLPHTEAHWTDADGVYGAGRMFRDRMDKGLPPGDLPENARIVFFPGNRMPDQPDVQEQYSWIKEHYR